MNPDQLFIIDIRRVNSDGSWLAPFPTLNTVVSECVGRRVLLLLSELIAENSSQLLEEIDPGV